MILNDVYELTAKLCREFEGLSLVVYKCPAGYATIGYGHRCAKDHPAITKAQAESYLREDIQIAYDGLIKESPGLASARPGQVAALTDFVFNLGIGRYAQSTLKQYVDKGSWMQVPALLERWVYGGGKILPGLVKRRAAESALLL